MSAACENLVCSIFCPCLALGRIQDALKKGEEQKEIKMKGWGEFGEYDNEGKWCCASSAAVIYGPAVVGPYLAALGSSGAGISNLAETVYVWFMDDRVDEYRSPPGEDFLQRKCFSIFCPWLQLCCILQEFDAGKLKVPNSRETLEGVDIVAKDSMYETPLIIKMP